MDLRVRILLLQEVRDHLFVGQLVVRRIRLDSTVPGAAPVAAHRVVGLTSTRSGHLCVSIIFDTGEGWEAGAGGESATREGGGARAGAFGQLQGVHGGQLGT